MGIDSSFFEPNKPQAWLESLDLNVVRGGDVKIIFTEVKAGTTFTKKCYLQVRKTSSLEGLEKQLQRTIFKSSEEEARKLFEEWDPHLSLLYWSGEVSDEQLAAIKTVVDEAGVDLSAGHTAWAGGRIQLVDTSKSVDQWKVLAERLIE